MNKDFGLLLTRLVVGAGIASHGAQKKFGWFEGPGLSGAGGFFEKLGFSPGEGFAHAAALSELTSGALIAAGALNPAGPALLWSTMFVAMRGVHWENGFFAAKNGYELPLLYSVAAFALALEGPGAYSLDQLFGIHLERKAARVWWAFALATAGAAAVLAQRQPPPPEPSNVADGASDSPQAA